MVLLLFFLLFFFFVLPSEAFTLCLLGSVRIESNGGLVLVVVGGGGLLCYGVVGYHHCCCCCRRRRHKYLLHANGRKEGSKLLGGRKRGLETGTGLDLYNANAIGSCCLTLLEWDAICCEFEGCWDSLGCG